MGRTEKTVHILNNGCDRRALDAMLVRDYLEERGVSFCDTPDEADYTVFFTCAFKASKAEECYEHMKKLKTCNGKIIISGCLPFIDKSGFKRLSEGMIFCPRVTDILVSLGYGPVDEKDANFVGRFMNFPGRGERAASVFFRFFREFEVTKRFWVKCSRQLFKFAFILKRVLRKERIKTAYLRLARGCSGGCSYCGIKTAVGELRSKPAVDCLAEYNDLLKRGFRDFTFVADNLGAYGLDIGSSLPKLFEDFCVADRRMSVIWTLKEIDPRWVVLYKSSILPLIQSGKVKKMLCAVQSGSDRILRLMNRGNCSGEIEEVLGEFRRASPSLVLLTQVIIGFPSETEEDFAATIDLVCRLRFDWVALYEYYSIPGTPASNIPGEVSAPVIEERMRSAKKALDRAKIPYFCDNASGLR